MISRDEVLDAARELYAGRHGLTGVLQVLRPRICPFEILVEAVPKGSSVLDVGCGSGLFLGLLARFGRISRGHGIDISASAIRHADQMRLDLDAPCELGFACQAPDEPWPEGPFDLVSMVDVMHHVPPIMQSTLFSAVASRLKPGGLFLYKDMAERPVWCAWANRLHDLLLARQWINYLPMESALGYAAEAHLLPVSQRSDRRAWYAHEMAVFRSAETADARTGP